MFHTATTASLVHAALNEPNLHMRKWPEQLKDTSWFECLHEMGSPEQQVFAQHILGNNVLTVPSFLRTILEFQTVFSIQRNLVHQVRDNGWKAGNRSMDIKSVQAVEETMPNMFYFGVTVVGPILEEILFRAVPTAQFVKGAPEREWVVGLLSSVIFAAIHNIRGDVELSKEGITAYLTVLTDSLPMQQLILGLYTWLLMQRRGFVHASLAHVLQNNYAFMNKSKTNNKQAED